MPFTFAFFLRVPLALPLLLLPVSGNAQTLAPPDTMLSRLTAEALAGNPALGGQQAMARAAQLRVRAAGALPDPMLTTGVMDLVLPTFAFRESDFTEVDVELEQEFPWPGTLGARTAGAQAESRSRQAMAAAMRRETVVRTAMLYYQLRYVASAQVTLNRQQALLESGVKVSTVRYASGSAPQSDPLQARLARVRLETEKAALAAEEASLQADLRALRNVRGSETLHVEPIDPAAIPGRLHHPDSLPVLLVSSIDENPRLAARQAAVEAAEQMVRVERLSGRPDFTVMARYGARPIASDFFSAFVGIRIPLWAGRKQHRLTDAAEAELAAARYALDEESDALQAELERTLAEARASEIRIHLLVEQVVPAASATVDATLRGYRVGQVDFLNLLAVEDALFRAELEVAQVAAEHLTHLVMLEQLLSQESDS